MTRKAFIVHVNLDPMSGAFHSQESALNIINAILKDRLFGYDPTVSLAPAELQPLSEEELEAKIGPPRGYNGIAVMIDRYEFADSAKAHRVLASLQNLVRQYGHATVADYLEMIDRNSTHYTEHYWGWRSADGFGIENLNNGSTRLILPPAVHLITEEGK